MPNEVTATPQMLEHWMFDRGCARCIFVMADGAEAGFALYFYNFSTFTGKAGLYLEDIFILPQYRGKGLGKALFLELVKEADREGYGRMDWICLDWNKPSIDFYKSLGAKPIDEWTVYRLTRDDIERLAAK